MRDDENRTHPRLPPGQVLDPSGRVAEFNQVRLLVGGRHAQSVPDPLSRGGLSIRREPAGEV
jgi:hypothetical protein